MAPPIDPARQHQLMQMLEAIQAELQGKPAGPKKDPRDVPLFFKVTHLPTMLVIRKGHGKDPIRVNVSDFDWQNDRPASPEDEAIILATKPEDFIPPWAPKKELLEAELKAQQAVIQAKLDALSPKAKSGDSAAAGDGDKGAATAAGGIPPEAFGKGSKGRG